MATNRICIRFRPTYERGSNLIRKDRITASIQHIRVKKIKPQPGNVKVGEYIFNFGLNPETVSDHASEQKHERKENKM